MKEYFLNGLRSLSQTANAWLLGGNEDHTISGHVGHMAKTTHKLRWLLAEKLINTLFWFDKNHCRTSIELDELK